MNELSRDEDIVMSLTAEAQTMMIQTSVSNNNGKRMLVVVSVTAAAQAMI